MALSFIPAEIIRKKRDGIELTATEISDFLKSYLSTELSEAQMSSLLMAIFFKGLSDKELFAWTSEIIDSGIKLDFPDLDFVVDKHSTGGVGDKVSIILAPMLAAMGMQVPMMSGRGLGHTGGTVDKLESIPGFSTQMQLSQLKKQLNEIGFVLIGQTKDLAPLDKVLYQLRDVTGTVESYPLIAASIISKKAAEGAKSLLLDVKVGTGAFMNSMEKAEILSDYLIKTGKHFGLKVCAMITDMNAPLGMAIGNALEIKESIDVLKGEGPSDLSEICIKQAAELAFMSGNQNNREEAFKSAKTSISNGSALKKLEELLKLQSLVTDINQMKLPETTKLFDFKAKQNGYLKFTDCRQLGLAALMAGASRLKIEDEIDYGAGIMLKKREGDFIEKGEIICEVFSTKKDLEKVIYDHLGAAMQIATDRPGKRDLIKKVRTS